MSKKFFILVFFLFSAQISWVYSQSAEISFEKIRGLSEPSANYIIQDQHGFMWVGTFGGLNKYDGYSFKHYMNDVQDSNSLNYEGVTFLFEDHAGYIWVVNNTSQLGIDRYDPRLDRFTHFKFDELDSTSISSNRVFHIAEDKDNQIWICTDNALNLVKPVNGSFDKIYFEKYPYPPNRLEPNGLGFSLLYVDAYENILLISPELYLFDRETQQFKNTGTKLKIADATSVADDGNGNVWIGTTQNGVIRLSYDEVTRSYRINPCATLGVVGHFYTFVTLDDENVLWVGTEPGGLYRYDPQADQLTHFEYRDHDPNSISENSIRSLYIDRTGVLWVGTLSQELCKADLSRKKFIHYKVNPGQPNSLSENLIGSISGVHSGEVWIGTRKDGGVDRLIFDNDNNYEVIHYRNDPANQNTLAGNNVLSLVQRKNGEVWIGIAGETLTQIIPGNKNDGVSDVIHRHYLEGWTFSMYEHSDGVLWGGTWNQGLWRLNEADGSFTKFYHDPSDSLSLCDNIIWAIHEDQNKNLWIGSNGNGMSILEASQLYVDAPRFINYRLDSDNPRSISHNTVNVFYNDQAGNMWIGTNGGLNLVLKTKDENVHDLEFKAFTTENGLPSNSVVGILEDEEHNLWISTSYGLSKFEPGDSTFTNYYQSDGLQDNVFLHNAFYKSPDGRMYFGGPNGISAFYPEDIKANSFKPEIVLTGLKIWNKNVLVGEEINDDIVLPVSINDLNTIVLSHENNVFTIEFAALHYVQPFQNSYAYYLENFEKDWNFVGGQRSATYTNLDPGTYIFKVKGSNNNGIWNEEGKSIIIQILPPWWERMWFRIGVIIVAIGLIILGFQWRTKSLMAQKIKLEKEVRVRTNELNKLVHELQAKQDEVETTNEELTSTLEDLFVQKEQIEKINKELEDTQEELKVTNSQLDKRVQERTSKLVKANQELDRFVYSASHDLSAPLKSIMGLINIASIEGDKEEFSSYMVHMKKSVQKLENVIKSLAQFSRNSGQELSRTEFLFQELVDEVLDEVLGIAKNEAVIIKTDFKPHQTLISDYLRLKMILANLISNAYKYRNTTRIDSTINIVFKEFDNEYFIEVGDNGIGIGEEHLNKIFDMFYRASNLSEGSGLGLYIVKESIDKLMGSIEVTSEKYEYTSFKIFLPKG